MLRIIVGTGGDVENVITQTSSGHPALDESAAQSVKTWRFAPAKDGEFPIATKVDLPVRFSLDEYGIKVSQPEPEPEPEPVREKKPARLIKSDRPLYPQVARKEGLGRHGRVTNHHRHRRGRGKRHNANQLGISRA